MDTGLLQFNVSGFKESGYSLTSNTLRCFYQEIIRPKDDDFNLEYGPQIPITGLHEPKTDFIYVACTNFLGFTVYSNFHAYVRKIPEVRTFKVITNLMKNAIQNYPLIFYFNVRFHFIYRMIWN